MALGKHVEQGRLAQGFISVNEDGTSDSNCVDVILEVEAEFVSTTQSTTPPIPLLAHDKSRALHPQSPQLPDVPLGR